MRLAEPAGGCRFQTSRAEVGESPSPVFIAGVSRRRARSLALAEGVLFLWGFGLAVEEAHQFVTKSGGSVSEHLSDVWNRVDLAKLSLILCRNNSVCDVLPFLLPRARSSGTLLSVQSMIRCGTYCRSFSS